MKYLAKIEIDNELQEIKFETDEKPVDYLWARYGMTTYIESVERLEK